MLRNVVTTLTRLVPSAKTIVPSNEVHLTACQESIFMKRQKKMDPEVAKQREHRRRKRLEKEIRQMQKHSKKPKPVDELTLDIKSAKNIDERYREVVETASEVLDEQAVILKEYTRNRNKLQKSDDLWLQKAEFYQRRALNELKKVSPSLYEQAVAPIDNFPIVISGPALTPPIPDYVSPDGDYINTTRTWS